MCVHVHVFQEMTVINLIGLPSDPVPYYMYVMHCLVTMKIILNR